MKLLPADTAPGHHTAQTELPSEVASVDAARELDEDDRYRLGLAVHEAVANAVVHGNRQKLGTA
ncbi:ATP-binding protein, partial [Streptomyces sp. NRRL S-495]|uniref:ATP-binding protein n=1 Tax=Streptomyces sp. NRRL S-495 TaxID=1609133 RepID=UPI002570ECF4